MVKTRVFRCRKKEDLDEKLRWLQENYGSGPELTNSYLAEKHRWSYQNAGNSIYVLYFNDENDYMFYLLRWG